MHPIAKRLIKERWQRNFTLPNYTPVGWWECDVFELTRAGFFREYEIKTSRSDFMADRKKYDRVYNWEARTHTDTYKHAELARRSPKGPSRFYFVVPTDLIKPTEIPEWAGLLFAEDIESRHGISGRIELRTIVEAPVLHRCKFEADRRAKIFENCYWRLNTILMR